MGTVKKLIVWGIGLLVFCLLWDQVFPINKKIWTSPYVLLTVGLDLFLIAFLMLVIEIWQKRNWTYPFEIFGRNPLVLYVLSGVLISIMSSIRIGDSSLKGVIYDNAFTSWLSPKDASLLFFIAYMLVIWLVGLWMDKRKIYIKV